MFSDGTWLMFIQYINLYIMVRRPTTKDSIEIILNKVSSKLDVMYKACIFNSIGIKFLYVYHLTFLCDVTTFAKPV